MVLAASMALGVGTDRSQAATPEQLRTLIQATNKRYKDQISQATFEEIARPIINASKDTSALLGQVITFSEPKLEDKADALIANLIPKNQTRAARLQKLSEVQEAARKAQQKAVEDMTLAKDAATAAAADPSSTEKAKEAKEASTKATASGEAATEAQSAASRVDAESGAADSGWIVNVWTGARLRNPYSITNSVLKPNNSTTSPFLELQLLRRAVFIQGENEDPVFWGSRQRTKGDDGRFDFFCPTQLFPDIDLKIGYLFGGSSSSTNNVSISTIAGGSDIYADGSVGLPFWRWSPASGWNQQLTVEAAGGFASDKQFLALHPNYFVGIGYQVHQRDWTWFTRLGIGGSDVPRRKDGTATIVTQPDGMPYFDMETSVAWGAQILYRLNDVVSVQFGMNAYFHDRPDWNVSLGLLIDPQKAFKSFLK